MSSLLYRKSLNRSKTKVSEAMEIQEHGGHLSDSKDDSISSDNVTTELNSTVKQEEQ